MWPLKLNVTLDSAFGLVFCSSVTVITPSASEIYSGQYICLKSSTVITFF